MVNRKGEKRMKEENKKLMEDRKSWKISTQGEEECVLLLL